MAPIQTALTNLALYSTGVQALLPQQHPAEKVVAIVFPG
jgi:hypothetical protein